jgi:hypothetical protein
MVVIRMGDVANPANTALALSGFDEELWQISVCISRIISKVK